MAAACGTTHELRSEYRREDRTREAESGRIKSLTILGALSQIEKWRTQPRMKVVAEQVVAASATVAQLRRTDSTAAPSDGRAATAQQADGTAGTSSSSRQQQAGASSSSAAAASSPQQQTPAVTRSAALRSAGGGAGSASHTTNTIKFDDTGVVSPPVATAAHDVYVGPRSRSVSPGAGAGGASPPRGSNNRGAAQRQQSEARKPSPGADQQSLAGAAGQRPAEVPQLKVGDAAATGDASALATSAGSTQKPKSARSSLPSMTWDQLTGHAGPIARRKSAAPMSARGPSPTKLAAAAELSPDGGGGSPPNRRRHTTSNIMFTGGRLKPITPASTPRIPHPIQKLQQETEGPPGQEDASHPDGDPSAAAISADSAQGSEQQQRQRPRAPWDESDNAGGGGGEAAGSSRRPASALVESLRREKFYRTVDEKADIEFQTYMRATGLIGAKDDAKGKTKQQRVMTAKMQVHAREVGGWLATGHAATVAHYAAVTKPKEEEDRKREAQMAKQFGFGLKDLAEVRQMDRKFAPFATARPLPGEQATPLL